MKSFPNLFILFVIAIFFVCLTNSSYGQTFNNLEQFTLHSKVYTIKAANQENGDYKYKITVSMTSPASSTDFSLIELKQDVFKINFLEALAHLPDSTTFKDEINKNPTLKEQFNEKADNLFYNIVTAALTNIDKSPASGYLTFEQSDIVSHDYFEFYGGVGLSKKRLLENLTRNMLRLYYTKDTLICMYRNLYKRDIALYKRDTILLRAIIDSVQIKYELKYTDINRRLTALQRRQLRALYTDKQIERVFPTHRRPYEEYSKCECKDSSLSDYNKYIIRKDSIRKVSKDSLKAGSEYPDSLKVRKKNKYLATIIENIQHTIAEMKGEIRDLKIKNIYRSDTTRMNNKILGIRESLEKELKDTLKAYRYIENIRNKLANDTIDANIRIKSFNDAIATLNNKIDSIQKKNNFDEYFLIYPNKKINNEQQKSLIQYRLYIIDRNRNIYLKNLSQSNIKNIGINQIYKFAQNQKYQQYLDDSLKRDGIQREILGIKSKKQNSNLKVKADIDALQLKKLSERIKNNLDTLNTLIEYEKTRDIITKANADLYTAKKTLSEVEKKLSNKPTPVGLTIKSIQVEFAAGNLKNIMVIGQIPKEGGISDSIIFVNPYPIPFSSIRDFNYSMQLFSFNYGNPPHYGNPPYNYQYWIHLSDVFKYVPVFYTDAEDYSPADTAFFINPSNQKFRILHKNPVDRLLEARIYSDFVGLNNENPNGLIQTEVSKRIILRPNRKPVIIGKRPAYFGGFLSYIEPIAALTKIEKQNRDLPLQYLTNATQDTVTLRSTTPINLLRYANFYVGAKLNLFVADFPELKSSFFLDIGTRLYRTAILDSITFRTYKTVTPSTGTPVIDTIFNPVVSRYNANSLMSFLELTWQIKPDHRFGFSISPRISYFDSKNPQFEQSIKKVGNLSDLDSGNPFWMFNVKIDAFIMPSENGRFFFRANYTAMYDNLKQDFFQAQLGYAFNILRRRPGQ